MSNIKLLFPEIDVNTVKHDFFCTIYPVAKQTRCYFTHSEIKTTHALELLHIDLWGPYRYASYTGCTMFLTVVDEFTRATWVFLMKYKSDYVPVIKQFVTYIEKQLDLKVKCIRSDNAKELSEKDALQFYVANGIKHETS